APGLGDPLRGRGEAVVGRQRGPARRRGAVDRAPAAGDQARGCRGLQHALGGRPDRGGPRRDGARLPGDDRDRPPAGGGTMVPLSAAWALLCGSALGLGLWVLAT